MRKHKQLTRYTFFLSLLALWFSLAWTQNNSFAALTESLKPKVVAIQASMVGTEDKGFVTTVDMIIQDEGAIYSALKQSQVKKLFSGNGPYPYFALQACGEAGPPSVDVSSNRSNTTPPVQAPDDPYQLVQVEGGTFTMGCTSEQRYDCPDSEKPSHQVTLSTFFLSKYEVTQAQWSKVMGTDPPNLNFKGCDECPVEKVSWEDVQEFLGKLNAQTGKKYRLPTEGEWEYAARGGKLSRGYKYAGSNNLDEVAWYNLNSDNKTHPVGQKKANELGLYDMSGNVCEWCQDWYGAYSSSTQTNPAGAGSGSSRVFRGSSWQGSSLFCRVSSRSRYQPLGRDPGLGIRLAL